ncbi:hypothetical protein Gpo141_00009142 [Globisporangium polare]
MDKVTTPAVPKRQSSLRNGLRLSAKPDASTVDGSSASTLVHDATMASSSSDNRSLERDPTAYVPTTPLESPTSQSNGATKSGIFNTVESTTRIDRSVESRTQFQITLPLSVGAISSPASGGNDTEPQPFDQRGWSSPHGEPYRPLGKPDLNLKFSPRLANGANLLQNAHRMKVFEGKDVKEKCGGAEVRHAHAVARHTTESGGSPASASRSPGLFELFPLNFANKKRPLDERQVKLAHRLHASMSHYSPEKVRGLRRHSPHQQPCEQQLLLLSTRDTDQKDLVSELHSPTSSQGADASVALLRKAIHECSSRLRSVKNGAGFLTHVPSSEHLDLLALQERYHRERVQFALSSASTSSSHEPLHHSGQSGSAAARTPTRGPFKASLPHCSEENPFDDKWGVDAFSNTSATANVGDLDSDDLYLPYTSRRLQKSPNKRHPTLSEFKSHAREEKMPRPLLSMQSPSGAGATEGLGFPTAGGAMTRSSIRVGGSILLSSHRSPDRAADSSPSSTVGTPAPPSPPRTSITLGISTQISDSAAVAGLSSLSMRTPRQNKPKPPQQKKLHSVERLQATVDALQDAKRTHSEQLAKTVESLNQDRRDCLAVKFRHFHVQHHLNDDIHAMRHASEMHRAEIIDDSVEKSGWYQDLLRQLLAREAVALHPAESFFVRAIRRIANEGHVFEKELFFRLILLLHRDDLLIVEVQQMLTFLRQALQVSLEHWEELFAANGLPEPAEIYERKELRQEKKQHRLAKLRAVATVNQAIRHFSRRNERSR